MQQMLRIVELGGIIFGVVVLCSLVITMVRGFPIPQCFYCGAIKVRPARSAGFWESAAAVILIRPYRCSGCRVRFHAMRLFG
jgi:hypothetical protein